MKQQFIVGCFVSAELLGCASTSGQTPRGDTDATTSGTWLSTESSKEHGTNAEVFPQGYSLWQGEIGSANVMLELRARGKQVVGRYYYEKQGRSLIVLGQIKDGQLTLEEQGGAKETVFGNVLARLEGTADAQGLKGDRHSLGEKQTTASFGFERLANGSYDQLRTKREKPVPALDGAFSTVSVRQLQEHLVVCDLENKLEPRLTQIPGVTVLTDECDFPFEGALGKRIFIDATFLEVQSDRSGFNIEETNEQLSPPAYAPGESWGGAYSSKLIYGEGNILSFVWETEGIGIGAYPAHERYGQTIDLRTGKIVSASELLTVPANVDFLAELDIHVPAKALKGDAGNSCKWSEISTSDKGAPLLSVYAHLSEKGLHLTPDWPHVMKPCQYANFGVLVPSDFASKYARPEGLLDEVLNKRGGRGEQH